MPKTQNKKGKASGKNWKLYKYIAIASLLFMFTNIVFDKLALIFNLFLVRSQDYYFRWLAI